MHTGVREYVNIYDHVLEQNRRGERVLMVDNKPNGRVMYVQFDAAVSILEILNVSSAFGFAEELVSDEIAVVRAQAVVVVERVVHLFTGGERVLRAADGVVFGEDVFAELVVGD